MVNFTWQPGEKAGEEGWYENVWIDETFFKGILAVGSPPTKLYN